MKDKEIKRLFESWNNMNTKTNYALSDTIRRIERVLNASGKKAE